jgi:hypothetical protein
MKPFDANGWTILFYTDFQLQWEDLTAKVVKLKSKLDPKDFVIHPDVKLLKAIDSGIRDKISIVVFRCGSRFSNMVGSKRWACRNVIGYFLEPSPLGK